jgi:ABC-type proline/glycine betaine transport system substrate-binding protein
MSAKILSTAIISGLLLAVAAPAFAADAPKTKADCEKAKMTWDDAKKVCVKK